MTRSILIAIALGLLAGCAINDFPPLTADNPASPSAPEAVGHPVRFSLGTDSATQRTRQLIAARAQQDSSVQPQQQQKDKTMPGMENMPGMEHQHQEDHEGH
jgi:hypothetical protein